MKKKELGFDGLILSADQEYVPTKKDLAIFKRYKKEKKNAVPFDEWFQNWGKYGFVDFKDMAKKLKLTKEEKQHYEDYMKLQKEKENAISFEKMARHFGLYDRYFTKTGRPRKGKLK